MAFKYSISFATDLAANFGCYLFRIMADFSPILLKISSSFHMKKKGLVAAQNLQSIKTFLTLEVDLNWVSVAREVGCFSQASWLQPTETARETRPILAWQCVLWLAQRAKTCNKIWHLGPVPVTVTAYCCSAWGWLLTCFVCSNSGLDICFCTMQFH